MPHAVIKTDAPIISINDKNVFFSSKGDFFIKTVSTECDDFIIRGYFNRDKIVVKLDKTTYPLITDDIKEAILEFAKQITENTKGNIVHHNLTPTGKECKIINRYTIKPYKLTESIPKSKEISLELGMGSGEFLLSLAQKNRETHFIGFEISNEAIAKAARRFKDAKLNNISIVNYDARYCLDAFRENSIGSVFVNFPEPWYKFKRIKHALINRLTVEKIARILKVGGTFEFLTDNLAYATSTALFCYLSKALESAQNRVIEVANKRIQTRYEKRWIRKKRQIYSVVFKKTRKTNSKQQIKIDFPVKIKKDFILKDGIIFKIMEIFSNSVDQQIAEVAFGDSKNPQHAYFGITKNRELFPIPQTVFASDEESQKAFTLAKS